MKHDVTIIGGGIVGLATAFRLLEAKSKLKILLLEKESKLAAHQTGNNSGVLHSGLYYQPGSEKAQCAVQGLQQMLAFCRAHGIAHEQCGKIVVATSQAELPRLDLLWERGNANGLLGLRQLNPQQIKEIEPYATGLAAIQVPQEGIVDYPGVCEKLGELIRQVGGEIRLNTRVLKHCPQRGRMDRENVRGRFPDEICHHLRRIAGRPARVRGWPTANRKNHSLPRRVLSDQKGTAVSGAAFDLSRA